MVPYAESSESFLEKIKSKTKTESIKRIDIELNCLLFPQDGKELTEIEKLFAIAFYDRAKKLSYNMGIVGMDDHGYYIEKQVEIGNYRADFVCHYVDHSGQKSRIVVECDSQEWHEKNEEQRRYEKQRDRDFLKYGYCTARFTGLQLMIDPLWCATEITSMLRNCQLLEVRDV